MTTRRFTKLSEFDVSTIRRMFGEGKTDDEIASVIGRTTTAVRHHRQVLRLMRLKGNKMPGVLTRMPPQDTSGILGPVPMRREHWDEWKRHNVHPSASDDEANAMRLHWGLPPVVVADWVLA